MNAKRRKRLKKVVLDLENLSSKLEEIRDEIDDCKCDEEDYKDNIPENLQESERFEKAENACEQLDESISCINTISDELDDITRYIEESME